MTTRDFLYPKTSGVGGYDLPAAVNLPGAACAEVDPELMYPVKGGSPKAAKRLCNEVCPVREACLEDALLHLDRYGIWGGLTDKERQRVRRERRAS